MGKVYLYQTALTLVLETFIDLSTASEVRIYYEKPSGETGYWSGTVDGTTITYDVDVPASGSPSASASASTSASPSEEVTGSGYDIDEAGDWKLWAWVKFNDNSRARGEAASLRVYS